MWEPYAEEPKRGEPKERRTHGACQEPNGGNTRKGTQRGNTIRAKFSNFVAFSNGEELALRQLRSEIAFLKIFIDF